MFWTLFSSISCWAAISEISHLAPRLSFGDGATCTGFLVDGPSCGGPKAPVFVTAAHCRFESDLTPIHGKFTLPAFRESISVRNSQANICHDMLARRISRRLNRRLKKVTRHRVAKELPKVGDELVALGFPVQVVGNHPRRGLSVNCRYEGVTKSDASLHWRADLLQHQMVCDFPFGREVHMGGMSGGPVLNESGNVVGVISQQSLICPEYAENCDRVRFLFTELTTEQFDCRSGFTTQRIRSNYHYEAYLPWQGKKIIRNVDARFDRNGCVREVLRSIESPSYHGDRNNINYRGRAPRL